MEGWVTAGVNPAWTRCIYLPKTCRRPERRPRRGSTLPRACDPEGDHWGVTLDLKLA